MTERGAWLVAAALALTGCATPPPSGTISFAITGDAPYHEGEEAAFAKVLAQMSAEEVAFSVHVGDTKGGGPCTDALYDKLRRQFDASRHPFVYTPGDNEWLECRDAAGRPIALERLARLREVYFSRPESLGAVPMPMRMQDGCLAPPVATCGCGALPENRAWSLADVAFVTLHVVGEEDNFGYDAARDTEARCRREGNLRWLDEAVARAIDSGARALVVIAQANPWLSTRGAHDTFIARLQRGARRFARPVLLVHGDTHTFRVDWPLDGITRVETYGSPFIGWVKVVVSPGEPNPFSFEGHLVAVIGRPDNSVR